MIMLKIYNLLKTNKTRLLDITLVWTHSPIYKEKKKITKS